MQRIFVFRFLLLTFCILSNALDSRAQIFPIQSQVQLTPPYSGNLSDYTSPGSQRIRVTLTSRDITLSNYQVKLRITIEGLGITVRTKQNLVVDPFVMDGGTRLVLYGDDLHHYLNPQNLDFIGFSKSEYQRSGKLPEGVYRFIVEVLDYNRGTVVSNKGFTTAWIILNDPPILNLPANNFKTKVIDPTNIAFTWTPRHTGSPNAAFTTNYIFRLVEIWPSNRNPNDAFLSQAPLVEIETSHSQLVYGPAEPALIPGRKYAWQVQARDIEGRDLFKNNGRSEVFVFQFGDALDMPQNVRKETANSTTISIRWEASPVGEIPERFRIRYRAEGGTLWFEDVTTSYWHTLGNLQVNKGYDIQVRAETATQVSDYTFSQRHRTTLPIADPDFQCGGTPTLQKPVMTTPLQQLNPGDVFRCADYDILVTEASPPSATGFYSGKGFAKIYMLNRANIAVAFSGTLNKEMQMVQGTFHSIAVDSKMSAMIEQMKKIGEKPPVPDADKQIESSTLIAITATVDSVYMNGEGEIVVLTEDGTTTAYEHKKDTKGDKQEMVVKDAAGNTWAINKDGTISQADAAIAGVYTTRDSLAFVVKFKRSESARYGFDHDTSFPTSASSKVNERDYVIGWKSVEQGKQDPVEAYVDQKRFPSKVGFKTEAQTASRQPAKDANSAQVNVTGGFEGDTQELVAYAKVKESGDHSEKDVILGKLNVVSYEYISKKLVVVPVNASTSLSAQQLQTRLNQIYGQAVAGCEVKVDGVFTVDKSLIEGLDKEESGNLASYNKKMRELNRAYKKSNPGYDNEAYYVFLIKGTDFRFDAFMPFKRGFGYVFVDKLDNNTEKIIQTIAHELGHGAFNLRHTFDQYAIAPRSTQNLMDYNGGQELKKYQWDYVHDPENMIGWFEDDEEGASLCTWWYQNVVNQIWSDSATQAVSARETLFSNIKNGFENYFNSSKVQNTLLETNPPWSFRKSAFNSTNNITLIDKVIKKMVDNGSVSYKLSANGIFLSKYKIADTEFSIAFLSEFESVSVDKIKVDDICDLIDNKTVRVHFKSGYTAIAFFKANVLQLSILVLTDDHDKIKLLLRYLGILRDKATILSVIQFYWNSLVIQTGGQDPVPVDTSFYGDIVPFPQIAPTSTFNYGIKNFKGGTYGCIRKVKTQNGQTAQCGGAIEINSEGDTLYIKHHNGLDIYAQPGTELRAVINGSVTYQETTTMAG
ncbi:MAG TPA: fibronectin type III domain-containing protein, partial [Sphingobacteriaceae bacterium]